MAAFTLILVGILALLVAVLLGALLEMYRDVRQLRDALGILDRPLSLDIGRVEGTLPSTHGLPQALDFAASAIVLFLSPERCGTCRALAAGLGKPLPEGLWVVLEARNAASAADFLDAFGLAGTKEEQRIIVDTEGKIAGRMGLNTSPVGLHLKNGKVTAATTVPSSRYLASILPTPLRLRQTG
jgi:hypothetical protein